ncbi:MAG: AAA family ATPase [Novosphingobium sp.]|nr:AAA family ATPase [Novosphingobium sp.]
MAETDDQRATIDFLSRPESYGLDGIVERIDTHAAIIFLAGEHAYKLKRAVRYPYLDFSTVARRREVCEAEWRLNRRTAPEIYLEVRSVNRQADGSLGFGKGEPVDWLVVMQRFGADDLLEAVAARGDLTETLVRDLADNIADFHDGAEVAEEKSGSGRLRKVIDGNREAMAVLPADLLSKADCESLYAASLASLEHLSDLLDRRAATGHVRHCHGDLHLANICLWQGKPTLFDCLEFDDGLATTDVLYDLAFLVMDLWEKGYRAQASLLFNRYLDCRMEIDGIAAMPLFLSVRAAVRAHVNATAAGRQASQADRLAKRNSAREYLEAALSFLIRPEPRLIAIGGLSGTGKSTLGAALAPDIGGVPGARWLRSDVMRKRLAGVAPETRLPPEAYTRDRNAQVYDRLMQDARRVLAAGHSVIVDAVFARPEERAEPSAIAKELGVPFLGLWLEAPTQTLLDRVSARKDDASDADRSVVERQIRYDPGDLADWHRVAAGGGQAEVLAGARRLLAPISGSVRTG